MLMTKRHIRTRPSDQHRLLLLTEVKAKEYRHSECMEKYKLYWIFFLICKYITFTAVHVLSVNKRKGEKVCMKTNDSERLVRKPEKHIRHLVLNARDLPRHFAFTSIRWAGQRASGDQRKRCSIFYGLLPDWKSSHGREPGSWSLIVSWLLNIQAKCRACLSSVWRAVTLTWRRSNCHLTQS